MRLFSDIEVGLFFSAGFVCLLVIGAEGEQMNGNQSHLTLFIAYNLKNRVIQHSNHSISVDQSHSHIKNIHSPFLYSRNESQPHQYYIILIWIQFEFMENNQQYKSLIDMGCSPILSEAAIRNTKSQDLSALLDWISDNSEKQNEWKEWLEKQKSQGEKPEGAAQTTQSIDHLVNKDFVQQLMNKGHSKNVAQKALLFSNNASVKMAQNWIEQHKYDPDFEEQVFITGQQENQPKLTPEEARKKLNELVEKARAIKKQRQEQQARERQKNRVKFGKEMVQAKRIAEEQAVKRQLELDRIQKAKDEAYKKQLVEQMRRERNAKLGIKEQGGSTSTVNKKQEVKYTKPEQVEIQCEQVKVGNHAYPDKAKTFFETAQIYVNNIIKNNGEEKFRKINKENKAFQSRVTEAFAGVQTLQVIGYEDDGNFLFMRNYDLKELQAISNIIQRYISYYN